MNDEAGWNAYKCDLMIELLREKFTQNEDLKTQLLDTAQLKLGRLDGIKCSPLGSPSLTLRF